MMSLAVAGVTNQLISIKLRLKNAAYFRAKIAITFESDILKKSNGAHFTQNLMLNKISTIILL